MSSGIGETVLDLIRDGTLDTDLDAVQNAVITRKRTLFQVRLAAAVKPLAAKPTATWKPPALPTYKPGDRVKFKGIPGLNGQEATVMRPSRSPQKWWIKPDTMVPLLEPLRLKRRPTWIAINRYYIEPA